ncbi:MAG: hypothetical protein AAGA77_17505 [Bacteroidota bacterium]
MRHPWCLAIIIEKSLRKINSTPYMGLKEKIGFAFVVSIFTLVIAGLFPSGYTLTFSAVVTSIAIILIAFFILKDNSDS